MTERFRGTRVRIGRVLSRALASESTQQLRVLAARGRARLSRAETTACFFHAVDDPMSLLVALSLRQWFPEQVPLQVRVVSRRDASLFPSPDRYLARTLDDAPALAELAGLPFPEHPGAPDDESVERARRWLLARQAADEASLERVCALGLALFADDPRALQTLLGGDPEATGDRHEALAEDNERALASAGLIASGSVSYQGLGYSNVDRLHRLRGRLSEELGRALPGPTGKPPAEQRQGAPGRGAGGPTLEFYFSLRSPYSYIAYARTLHLCAHHGVNCEVLPILPMRMRGLPVPRRKTLHILTDCAAEARHLGIPFGDIADPLGAGVERAYAVWHHARQLGLERSWLEHAMTACWSEGVDLASDEGLFSVAERVGLALPDVRESLNSEAWRAAIEANMARHEAAGFWGVPCYAYGDLRTWGQDRLVLVEREILRRAAGA